MTLNACSPGFRTVDPDPYGRWKPLCRFLVPQRACAWSARMPSGAEGVMNFSGAVWKALEKRNGNPSQDRGVQKWGYERHPI